jgi:hypothetical protein
MNKKKKGVAIPENGPFAITAATLKDDLCNYSYDILDGVGAGDTHTVKGKGIADDDLIDAFRNLNVHLACVDDVFKHNKVELDNIDNMHNNEFTALYHVTGFKIKGSAENESVVLIGVKSVSCSGERISLESPRIPLDGLSSYKWYNELLEAIDHARAEVALYKGGKCTIPEADPEPDRKQLKITIGTEEENEDFSNAKL